MSLDTRLRRLERDRSQDPMTQFVDIAAAALSRDELKQFANLLECSTGEEGWNALDDGQARDLDMLVGKMEAAGPLPDLMSA